MRYGVCALCFFPPAYPANLPQSDCVFVLPINSEGTVTSANVVIENRVFETEVISNDDAQKIKKVHSMSASWCLLSAPALCSLQSDLCSLQSDLYSFFSAVCHSPFAFYRLLSASVLFAGASSMFEPVIISRMTHQKFKRSVPSSLSGRL
jgi:hypothetical protein